MSLPASLSDLLQASLQSMQNHPEYHLLPAQRYAIYLGFGDEIDLSGERFNSNREGKMLQVPFAQRVYGSLALISAKHVLPVWEDAIPAMLRFEDDFPIEQPFELLECCENVLELQPGSIGNALMLLGYYHGWLGVVASEQRDGIVSRSAEFAAKTIETALEAILGTRPFQDGINATSSNEVPTMSDDIAALACAAYCTIPISTAITQATIPWKYVSDSQIDLQKRREFWEWWLIEAIPAAWEQAALYPSCVD